MPGYIHMYANNSHNAPRVNTVIELEGNYSNKAYLPNLRRIDATPDLRSRINSQLFGKNLCQGNLGTLSVYPCDPRFRRNGFIYRCLFSQDVIEFSLTPNMSVRPAPRCAHSKDQLTIISFRQFNHERKQFHDVTLSSNATFFYFELKASPVPEKIDVAEWEAFYKKEKYQVDITETYFDMSHEEFMEQLFKEAPPENRANTPVISAFKPLETVEDYAVQFFKDQV